MSHFVRIIKPNPFPQKNPYKYFLKRGKTRYIAHSNLTCDNYTKIGWLILINCEIINLHNKI